MQKHNVIRYIAGIKHDYHVIGWRRDLLPPYKNNESEAMQAIRQIKPEDLIQACIQGDEDLQVCSLEGKDDDMASIIFKGYTLANVFLCLMKINLKTGKPCTGKPVEKRLYYNEQDGLYINMGKYKYAVKDFIAEESNETEQGEKYE